MLSARSVTKSYDGTPVLAGVSCSITDGTRLGIVGRNGAGKTTLLRILAGVETFDGGTVERAPRETTVGYLPQETDARPGETLHAYLARRTGVAEASQRLDDATAALGGDDASIAAYSDALEAFLAVGGDDFDARAGEVCASVGLAPSRLDVEVGVLSGGEASRAALAAILLSRVDVLLLDEPTNDLDFAGLDLLESFLVGRAGGLAVVSHDRAFLDRTCTRIIELHEEHHTAKEYAGGWSDYVAARNLARSQQYAAHEKWQAERSALKSRVQSQREWSSQGIKKAKKSGETDKFIRHKNTTDSEKLVGKVRISEKALERIERERVDKPWEGWELRLELGAATRPGDVAVRTHGAVVRRGAFTLGPVDVEIGGGEHVAILGPNGSGKSTLLGLLTGAITPDDGTVWRGPSTVFGTLDQSRVALEPTSTLLDAFTADTGLLPVEARTLLAKFSLGADHMPRHVQDLSPGERTRAILAALSARGVNCLVLDEPTNHLDLEAIEQLEGALSGYDGTVLLVTHDRAFLDRVSVQRTIEVRNGTVHDQQ